jgi:thiamine transport system permease protein
MPAEYDRLAHQLGMGFAARFRHVLWPFMRPALMSSASLIFMLCVTSFAVVLTLGGGPRATTLEVAIYQALTFDFDVVRAILLALIQVIGNRLCLSRLLTTGRRRPSPSGFTARRAQALRGAPHAERLSAPRFLWSRFGVLFVLTPFVVIVWRGISADLGRPFVCRPACAAPLTTSLAARHVVGRCLRWHAGPCLCRGCDASRGCAAVLRGRKPAPSGCSGRCRA